jgi:ATP-dependent protease HslVU (ClpYQ) peptidase subunit
MLIGTAGDQRISDIIEYNCDPEEDYRDDPVEYIAMDFLPAMRDALKKHGGLTEESTEATIMIGYKGHLFIIGEDFSLSQVGPYESIGAGAKYAMGYMYAMEKTCLSPERLIEGALACAEYCCAGVRGPFVVMGM